MTAHYTYLAADLLTNEVYAELPLHGVTFDRQINTAGSFQGSSSLDNDRLPNDILLTATTPGRTALYVYRDDAIVWGGILWSRTYQSQAKALQVYGQSFESYAKKRIYRPSATIKYTDTQCALINTLWRIMQTEKPNSNIGVRQGSVPAGDITRTMTVNPWDGKFYGDYIDDPLLIFSDSAEWTIECYEEAGVPIKQLTFGDLLLGRELSNTELVIDYPGSILNYYWTDSAASGANAAYAWGDGENTDVKVGYATNQTSLDAGYPLLEISNSYQGVTVQATINSHAANDLSTHPMPTSSRTFELKADMPPAFGTYQIGDYARVRIEDPFFPTGIDTSVRVLGWSVTPASSDSTEQITWILDDEASVSG